MPPAAAGRFHDVFAELDAAVAGSGNNRGRNGSQTDTVTVPAPSEQRRRRLRTDVQPRAGEAGRLSLSAAKKRRTPRTSLSAGLPAGLPARTRLRRTPKPSRKLREQMLEDAAQSNTAQHLHHALPRHVRDKGWRVRDLEGLDLKEDGSLRCVVLWEPTIVDARDLTGRALCGRLERLFRDKYGDEAWEQYSSRCRM